MVYLIFFLSGISGLIYEVIWVRGFGNIFGNTIYSSALVTGVFMGGLGVGSYLAGRFSDRKHAGDPAAALRAYAMVEWSIAGFGFLIATALPPLERWSASLSSYQRGAEGWYRLSLLSHLGRYALALLLLAPVTLLMGATLTLLMRFILASDLRQTGRRTGLLYGFNTLGAACGSLVVDFKLIPAVGLSGSQQIAVGFNLLAGLFAWLLLRATRAAGAPAETKRAPSVPGWGRTLALATTVLCFTGFAGMGLEIVWFRFLTSALGQLRSVFSLLLAVILVGIWLGSLVGGYLGDRYGRPRLVLATAQLLFAASTVAAFLHFDVADAFPSDLTKAWLALDPAGRTLYETLLILRPIVMLVGLPALCIGCCFPLANAIAQTDPQSIGRSGGILYLGNTLGALAGSLAAGFLFLPALGMKWSILGCLLVGLASLVPLVLSAPDPGGRAHRNVLALGIASLPVVVAGTFAWSRLPADYLILRRFRAKAEVGKYLQPPWLLSVSEGLLESIVIVEDPDDRGGKRLYTNGHRMSGSTIDAQRYMRAMVHLPLLSMDTPQSVLVICFGVGNTLHAASLYPTVKHLEIADLSEHILDQAPVFSDSNGNILKDPRVSVFVNDGRQHLRMSGDGSFDLVTLEPPPISFAGVASLYSVEFYRLARQKLKPGGFVTQWLPIQQLPGAASLSLIRAFMDVFPDGVLLAGDYGDFILMGKKEGEILFDPPQVARRLAAAPAVQADLDANHLGTMLDLAGSFLADSATLRQAVARVAPVTDDNPIMEYSRTLFVSSATPAEVINPQSIGSWCPHCLSQIEGLPAYLKLNRAMFRDSSYRALGPFARPPRRAKNLGVSRQDLEATLAHSPYLQTLLPGFEFTEEDFTH